LTAHALPLRKRGGIISNLNTRWHRAALLTFGAIVVLHWLEHLVQAFQIWALDMKRPEARGVLGQWFPWIIKTEWLHYGFAVVMLAGLAFLLPGFTGRGKAFWMVAFLIQAWHLVEHQILFVQATTGDNWWDSKVPVSILQHYVFPGSRAELHLLYNALVTIPMVVAMFFHMYPPPKERSQPADCSCSRVDPIAA
jgi:hypothetical protein